MIDIIEYEKKILDTIVAHVDSFDWTNVILIPSNMSELPKPYLGVQTLEISPTGRINNYPIDEVTGERVAIQDYDWKVRFTTVGKNDENRTLSVSSMSLAQELVLKFSTYLVNNELNCNSIALRRVGCPKRLPQLIADEWVDQAHFDVVFGLADKATEFISFIEEVEITKQEFARGPDDPDPIDLTQP